MTTDTWTVQGLEAGDEVAVRRRYNTGYYIGRVERVTKTMVVLSNGNRFRRNTGIEVGADWSSEHLHEPTDEIKKSAWLSVLRARAARLSNRNDIYKLTADQCKRLIAIFEEAAE